MPWSDNFASAPAPRLAPFHRDTFFSLTRIRTTTYSFRLLSVYLMLPRSFLSALFLDCIWNACNNNASFPFMTRLMTPSCASVKLSSRAPPPRAIVPIAGSSRNLVKPELGSPVVFLSPEAYHAISSSSPKRRSSGRPGVPFLLETMQAGVRQLTFKYCFPQQNNRTSTAVEMAMALRRPH